MGQYVSLNDEEGNVLPELAKYQAGKRGEKRDMDPGAETTEPKTYPPIPSARMPRMPISLGMRDELKDAKLLEKLPKLYKAPTEKQIELRKTFESTLAWFRGSCYHMNFNDCTQDGGKQFEEKAKWIKPGMQPAYYPIELTMKFGEVERQREKDEMERNAKRGMPGQSEAELKMKKRKERETWEEERLGIAREARMGLGEAEDAAKAPQDLFARLEEMEDRIKRETSGRPQQEVEDEDEEPEEEEDDLDEYDDGDQYANFDDDDGIHDDDRLEGDEDAYC